MSYSHTQKRKLIGKLKREHGNKWFGLFKAHRAAVIKEKQGPLLGSIEDIMNAAKAEGKWMTGGKKQ